MNERTRLIEWLRGEVVGPGRWDDEPAIASFDGETFKDPKADRSGALAWRPSDDAALQEVLYFERESPHRKYGIGLLHPEAPPSARPDEAALLGQDTLGVDRNQDDAALGQGDASADDWDDERQDGVADDFDVASPDVRQPSCLGISLCVRLDPDGSLVVRLPSTRQFAWQSVDAAPIEVNGWYRQRKRATATSDGEREDPVWQRLPAIDGVAEIQIAQTELVSGKVVRRDVGVASGCPVNLRIEVFPRRVAERWLITVILRNRSSSTAQCPTGSGTLYQSYFEVTAKGGELCRYPESQRPFTQLDAEEQSLALLYRESATWAIGHGCAAGWDAGANEAPTAVYADVFPAVELPSMTPDLRDEHGEEIRLSMQELSMLDEACEGSAWASLVRLATGYRGWIDNLKGQVDALRATSDAHFVEVARRHLAGCEACYERIIGGLKILQSNATARIAFRLTNEAMLLQQLASKSIQRRDAVATEDRVTFIRDFQSPSALRGEFVGDSVTAERKYGVGRWRAFQLAFFLMSLEAIEDPTQPSRETVDLIWFPTGGGKTEAYLAVAAFYLFHQRLSGGVAEHGLRNDGTGVLMRYTLRMLTTQQFQRAASLVCAMELLRREREHQPTEMPLGTTRFSLGLWVGNEGSPNTNRVAREKIARFRDGTARGNPLVLSECPWCRAAIGRVERPAGAREAGGRNRPRHPHHGRGGAHLLGMIETNREWRLLCPDSRCPFGKEASEDWLPVEVIDERIYSQAPSILIATADKFATVAYRPEAMRLFGREAEGGTIKQVAVPPGLVIQDELHLISGPLGTMYALYETMFERLCSYECDGKLVRPKIIASTATIRGAAQQVRSLYAREKVSLFPSPGLSMGDSYFGRYATKRDGSLEHGRLYLGLHASNFGSLLTTQVRVFAATLFKSFGLPEGRRDPWWTLLAFYNSLRELGGAKTLFDADIRSRLKFLFNRECASAPRRNLKIVEELTSRLSQPEIVEMMDRLAIPYAADRDPAPIDACLASNIIEVGVDIDRLSVMGVVGQPKTTSSYIQVTGRVGRRWRERPGLILMLYSPSKSRDRSHYEQFHSYHRRLYERVEPTSATPFAITALQRGMIGALLVWARQHSTAPAASHERYMSLVREGAQLLAERCKRVGDAPEDVARAHEEQAKLLRTLLDRWAFSPSAWEKFPPEPEGDYLMLWPGQYYSERQRVRGLSVPSSMRQVDRSAELEIAQLYFDK